MHIVTRMIRVALYAQASCPDIKTTFSYPFPLPQGGPRSAPPTSGPAEKAKKILLIRCTEACTLSPYASHRACQSCSACVIGLACECVTSGHSAWQGVLSSVAGSERGSRCARSGKVRQTASGYPAQSTRQNRFSHTHAKRS
jgi:hypothetical protein